MLLAFDDAGADADFSTHWAGGVLCCLLVIPGDLTISLQSRTPVQAGIFLFVYSTAVLLYLKLVKSDPGFMQTEEHHTLLEDGEIRRLSKDSHDSSNGVELRQRVGNVGPSKEEPDLRTSLAAALDPHAHNDPDSDSEDVNAAEDFLGRVSKHVSERRHRRGPGPPAHVENTVAAEGAVEEGAAEGAAETRRKIVNDDGLSEITLCVEENSASTIHQDAAEASSEQRQCSLCNVKQPLRTKHCYACGRCVNTFDHHCFWIGNCVGEKNHRLFWWFLFSETLTVCWASSLAASTFQYTDGANFISGWFMLNTPSLICLMMCLGFVVMMAALLGFHSYLIYTGQTTWEVFCVCGCVAGV